MIWRSSNPKLTVKQWVIFFQVFLETLVEICQTMQQQEGIEIVIPLLQNGKLTRPYKRVCMLINYQT